MCVFGDYETFAYISNRLIPIKYYLKYRWGLGSLHVTALTTLKLKICYTYLGLGKTTVTLINGLEVKWNISDSKSYPKLGIRGCLLWHIDQ